MRPRLPLIISRGDLTICRYFLFLLANVVFIFLLASTYWQLVRDLANSPAKIPEKLAQALQMGRARSEIPKHQRNADAHVLTGIFSSLMSSYKVGWLLCPLRRGVDIL